MRINSDHKPDYFLVLPWHFKENIFQKERELLENGCKFLFPLPIIDIVDKNSL